MEKRYYICNDSNDTKSCIAKYDTESGEMLGIVVSDDKCKWLKFTYSDAVTVAKVTGYRIEEIV